MKKWLPSLEKKLEHYSQGSHLDYRVFMSAEPAATPSAHIIPQVLYNITVFQYIFNLYEVCLVWLSKFIILPKYFSLEIFPLYFSSIRYKLPILVNVDIVFLIL